MAAKIETHDTIVFKIYQMVVNHGDHATICTFSPNLNSHDQNLIALINHINFEMLTSLQHDHSEFAPHGSRLFFTIQPEILSLNKTQKIVYI